MSRRVITLARTLGAGGEEVGSLVAKELGLRYADDEIIVAAAERAGVPKETVERFEHPPGLIGRILDSMAVIPLDPQMYCGQALTEPVAGTRPGGYDQLIRQVIAETARRGDVLIVAHGASIALTGVPGVLRVFVTAPEEVRAARVAAQSGMDPKAAAKAIENSDRERRDFLRRAYDLSHEQAANYDLVVSTETLSPAAAAKIIAAAAQD